MINREKVSVMTCMAAYEAGEGKQDLKICGYFKSDYVGFQLLKTWIYTTIAFCIMAAVYVLYEMDTMMDSLYSLQLDELLVLGKKFVFVYIVVCGIYMVFTYVVSHFVYKKAHRSLVLFDRKLNMIEGSEEEEQE